MSAAGASREAWYALADAGFLEDLLPVVCDPKVPTSAFSQLSSRGKVPSQINGAGEAHGIKGWPDHVTTAADLERWASDDRLGIAIQTRKSKVFDVDIEDAELAKRVEDILRTKLRNMTGVEPPLRFRENSSKFAILVRCEAEIPKRVINLGHVNKIELLGNGQQAVISGTHPSGSRILWEGNPGSAPDISAEQIDVVWQALIDAFGVTRMSTNAAAFDQVDFTIGHEPKLGLSVEDIERAIAALDPDMGREDWIKVGLAIHLECDGDDTGLAIWDEWSSKGGKYSGRDDLEYQYNSFRGQVAGKRPVTMRTVLKMAKEASHPVIAAGPVPKAVEPSLGKAVEPFPGFMADVVELALATAHKRQPELTVLGVLVAMAAACGSASHLPDGMRLNLYGIGAATTGSGKDHVLRVASTIVRASGATLLGDFASGPGLEDALKEGGLFANIDEIAHVLAARGEQGTAHLKDIERMLLKLFSASQSDYLTRAKAGTMSRTIANPSLSLMGFAVPAKLGEALTDGDIASGLLNRMLFAAGDGAAPPQPGVRQKFELSNEMLSKLGSIGLAHSAITLSDEVEQRVEALKFGLYDAEQRLLEETPERLLLGRTLEKSLRIAGVLAVFDTPGKPMVKLEHLDWAVGFVRESDAALLKFIKQHMHGGKVQADAAKVQDIARSVLANTPPNARPTEIAALTAGYAPISLITKRAHLNAKEMEEAIKLLSMRGDMVRSRFKHEPTVGRLANCEALCFPE